MPLTDAAIRATYDQEDAEFSRSARLPLARISKTLGLARIDAILAGASRVYKMGFSRGHWMRKPAEAGPENIAVG
jgi:hypothetical protein